MKEKRKKYLFLFLMLGICIILFIPSNFYWGRYLSSELKCDSKQIEKKKDNAFVVMSYNIRCWTFMDAWQKSWLYRANLLMSNIAEVAPDIIGFQEVTEGQYEYLERNLVGYESIIQYRDKSPFSEGCPIFYNLNRYDLLEKQSFWLSDTPEEMSKDDGAGNYRICTYVILKDKDTEKKLAVFNTHLDHKSVRAQRKGLDVIIEQIAKLGDIPVVLMGDFNFDETDESYQKITNYLADSKYEAEDSVEGNTYQNWGEIGEGYPIDYIMFSKHDFSINTYEILTKTYENQYPSDHYPIYVEMITED